MPEPTVPAAAAAAAAGLTVAVPPALMLFGVPTGMRPDDLIAGAVGAAAAILLLGAVPSTGDTARELVRTTGKRAGFALISAAFAGYAAPVVGAVVLGMLGTVVAEPKLAELATPLRLLGAAVIGAGAERFLRAFINRGASTIEGKPAAKPEGGA